MVTNSAQPFPNWYPLICGCSAGESPECVHVCYAQLDKCTMARVITPSIHYPKSAKFPTKTDCTAASLQLKKKYRTKTTSCTHVLNLKCHALPSVLNIQASQQFKRCYSVAKVLGTHGLEVYGIVSQFYLRLKHKALHDRVTVNTRTFDLLAVDVLQTLQTTTDSVIAQQ